MFFKVFKNSKSIQMNAKLMNSIDMKNEFYFLITLNLSTFLLIIINIYYFLFKLFFIVCRCIMIYSLLLLERRGGGVDGSWPVSHEVEVIDCPTVRSLSSTGKISLIFISPEN